MTVERSIFSISEKKAVGMTLVSSSDVPRVRIEMTDSDEGAKEYTVKGLTPLTNEAVGSLLQAPLGDDVYDWQTVRDGLRDITFPSRKVAMLSRSAAHRRELNEVKGSTKELVNIMDNDQDYWVKTGNMPVFTVGQAQQYATDVLYHKTPERKLLSLLKTVGLDPRTAQRIQGIIAAGVQSPTVVKELEAMTGIKSSESRDMQARAILNEVDSRYVVELIIRLEEMLFVGFPERAHLEDGKLVGGSNDLTVLLREKDIPVALPLDFSHVNPAAPRVEVHVGNELPDKDKKTGLSRHQVSFYTHSERQIALPQLSWRTTKDGERSFIFPFKVYQKKREGVDTPQQLAFPNSLLGVALAAQTFGKEAGIDYDKALRKRMRRLSSRVGRAGLWPLVATYHQQDILKHPYFKDIEKLL